jgi:hypothetical protein
MIAMTHTPEKFDTHIDSVLNWLGQAPHMQFYVYSGLFSCYESYQEFRKALVYAHKANAAA